MYRTLQYGRVLGSRIEIGGRSMINLGSNDYLAIQSSMPQIPHSSSSRLISGNDTAYQPLEEALAAHSSCESALVYPTGYMAALGCIPPLAVSGYTIFSDELNHASIIDACRLSGGRIVVYAHNDVEDLASKIRSMDGPSLIITEGIFSMDGDYSPLRDIVETASRYDIPVIVDDAHGDFVAGDGRGCAAEAGVEKQVYCTISSLSKALGSFGGYVASDDMVRDLLVNTSRPLIYTSALPAPMLHDALCRIKSDMGERRHRLYDNVQHLVSGLHQLGLCDKNQSHIIPIMLKSERRAMQFSESLACHGVYARAVRYPTVPRDMARIRISVTAALSHDDIQETITAFEHAAKH